MYRIFVSQKLQRMVMAAVFATLFIFSIDPTATKALETTRLLPVRLNVEATSDRQLDITLPTGFILSGRVRSEDGRPMRSGSVYAGEHYVNISPETGAYELVVPPGVYDLSVSFTLQDSLSETIWANSLSDFSKPLVVQEDQTVDITVPVPHPTATVSGTVSNMGELPTEGMLVFDSVDDYFFATTSLDENYSARLPSGTYNVFVYLVRIGANNVRQTAMVWVGPVQIREDAVESFHIELPATITLSGTITDATGVPVVPSILGVFNSTSQSSEPSLAYSYVNGPEDSVNGFYRLVLLPGSYNVSAGMNIDLGGEAPGVFIFSLNGNRSIMSDQTLDIAFPPLPSIVVFSGRVTDDKGQPVAGATVRATTFGFTEVLDGAATISGETDTDGRFNLKVLRGGNYTVAVEPPGFLRSSAQSLAPLFSGLRKPPLLHAKAAEAIDRGGHLVPARPGQIASWVTAR